jgi:hypothetical protein
MLEGREAYIRYQRRAGPRVEARDKLWFDLKVGECPVFVADTRTRRRQRVPGRPLDWQIMDDEELSAICGWLARGDSDAKWPRFIACPSMPLPRRYECHRRALDVAQPSAAGIVRCDSWDGYPGSLHALLDFIAAHRIEGVVFLSGDEHTFSLARITLTNASTGEKHVVHSVHSSPLYAPYPFANSQPEDFPELETFEFTVGTNRYSCEVSAEFMPGVRQGFVELRMFPPPADRAGRCLYVGYHDSAKPKAQPAWRQVFFTNGGGGPVKVPGSPGPDSRATGSPGGAP